MHHVKIVTDITYIMGTETLTVKDFTCATHTPAHVWKYIKHSDGTKVITQCASDIMGEVCSEFDAL